MPFAPLIPHRPHHLRAQQPATFTVMKLGHAKEFGVMLSLAPAVAHVLADATSAAVLIGSGRETGRLRVVDGADHLAAARGIRRLRGGTIQIWLGAVPFLRDHGAQTVLATAEAAAGGVDVVLPDTFRDPPAPPKPAPRPEIAAAPKAEAAPKKAAPKPTLRDLTQAAQAMTAKPARVEDPPEAEDAEPIRIITDPGREAVIFRGRSIEVSATGAKLVGLLARAFGQPIGRSFLMEKLYGNSNVNADTRLSVLASDLKALLPKVGLQLDVLRGVGIRLSPAELKEATS